MSAHFWLLIGIAGAAITAIAVSRAIRWATRRNAFWAMGEIYTR